MSHHPTDFLANDDEQYISEADHIKQYQELINSGICWRMEGSVGREAMSLIRQGLCMLGENGCTGSWGNYIPSRYEVQPGTKGSPEYASGAQLHHDR